jgi:hypothetical protein
MEKQIYDPLWKRWKTVEPEVVAPFITSGYEQQLELQLNKTVDATPEDVRKWQNGGDFFMTGDFDAMKFFVVIPAVIQIVVFFMMLAVMALNEIMF